MKSESHSRQHPFASDQPNFYIIRIEGALNSKWKTWFEDFTMTIEDDDTILSGWVVDQSALYGLLTRISDLGLPLISVERLDEHLDTEKEADS